MGRHAHCECGKCRNSYFVSFLPQARKHGKVSLFIPEHWWFGSTWFSSTLSLSHNPWVALSALCPWPCPLVCFKDSPGVLPHLGISLFLSFHHPKERYPSSILVKHIFIWACSNLQETSERMAKLPRDFVAYILRSYHVTQAGINLMIVLFLLLGTGITGVCHPAWLGCCILLYSFFWDGCFALCAEAFSSE